jgi:DNA-binding transcriptional LysR family regulator
VELTLAGPSYLVGHVLPAVVGLLPSVRIRGLELAPAHLRAHLAENVFDVALAPGGMDNRLAAWTDDVVGTCRSTLMARPSFAKRLGSGPLTPDRVRSLPFVGPARVGGDRFALVGDDCPIAWEKRWIAHESQTVASALEVVSRADLVVFCPVLAATRLLSTGEVVEVPVAGWDVREQLHVLCSGDRVLSRVQQAVVQAAEEALQRDPVCQVDGGDALMTRANGGAAALSS